MVGVHLLIGIGEGLITAATVASVLAVRPDLVRGAMHLRRPLELRTDPAALPHPRLAGDRADPRCVIDDSSSPRSRSRCSSPEG